MSAEWTSQKAAPHEPEHEYRATFEGLVLLVVHDRYGVRWSVVARLDDFILTATGHAATTVDEAKTAALRAARRLRELGAEGRP